MLTRADNGLAMKRARARKKVCCSRLGLRLEMHLFSTLVRPCDVVCPLAKLSLNYDGLSCFLALLLRYLSWICDVLSESSKRVATERQSLKYYNATISIYLQLIFLLCYVKFTLL